MTDTHFAASRFASASKLSDHAPHTVIGVKEG